MLTQLNKVCAEGNQPDEQRLLRGMKTRARRKCGRSLVNGIRQGQVYWLDFAPVTSSAPAERHPYVVSYRRSR
jgi:hypothetical protein